jgi:NAD(P)-dependent dehydrogenase (short-subunit alcohol dehydrogenase family)
MRLEGKTVVVTGAARGIGRATARRCSEEGARVVATDIDRESGAKTETDLEETPGAVVFEYLNVSDYNEFERLLADVSEEFDGVDVLVNNAGISSYGSIGETSIDERNELFSVNLVGAWNGCRAGIKVMKGDGGGSIVNVSSVTGLLGLPNCATYAVTKAGVLNLTYSLAAEVGPHYIRVNAVCPGRVETSMLDRALEDYDDPNTARERAASEHALNRMGNPREIADCIVFLASDEASFVTGDALVADGGARFRQPVL